jgi:low temperature requirement protein LtrA
MTSNHSTELLRDPAAPRPISYMELFFDLAFVYALTQLDRTLTDDLSTRGGLRALLLLAAFWWVWTVTAWSTDWFNPEHPFVRGLLVWVMFGGLLLAAATPRAFGDYSIIFAGVYTAIHLGRGAGLIYRLRGHPAMRRSARVAVWFTITGVAWLAGALLPAARYPLWTAAIIVDATIGLVGYPVPVLGRSTSQELGVRGEHLAERYRQFVIIAIGELILISGMSFYGSGFHPASVAAFVLAFANALLFILIYHIPLTGDGAGAPRRSPTPAQPALVGGYLHLLLLAGILSAGAGNDMVIEHAGTPGEESFRMLVLAGGALFLAWRGLVVVVTVHRWPRWPLVGLLAMFALAPAVAYLPLIAASVASDLVLLAVAAAESSRSQRGHAVKPS